MDSNAKGMATSIGQVTLTSLVNEDYSPIIDHCLKVLTENPSILYIVVTRKDGFSLIHAQGHWSSRNLNGMWRPASHDPMSFILNQSDLVSGAVFHYSYPLFHSGIEWGWIHIGLSLEQFHKDVRENYRRIIWLAIVSIFSGLAVSYFFAKRLSQPIKLLSHVTQQVASGDLSARAQISSGDEMEGLANSFNRMTEALQKAREDLVRAKDAAESASRFKSQFLANVSHEIRTPMNGVLGMTELLLNTPLTSRQRRFAEIIHRSGKIQLNILNDVLDFSKIEAGRMELASSPFNLPQVVQEVMDVFSESPRIKGLTVRGSILPGVPTFVKGDPDRLRQILTNLLSNAIKFTDQGEIVLQLEKLDDEGQSVLLSFKIQDTGIGISPEAQAHIFEAFSQADYSTTRKYGGTGLGLAIVKQMVEMLGGEISFTSQLGKGSTFLFTVPFLRLEDQQNPNLSEEKPRNIILNHTNLQEIEVAQPDSIDFQTDFAGSVLVVEDNPINQEVSRAMLENLNYRVFVVTNGRQAIEALERQPYDLVLMDCQMPEMDGYDASRTIRKSEALQNSKSPQSPVHVPIIAVTAHAYQADQERCLFAGMDDYLAKPFNQDQLKVVLDRWLPETNKERVPAPEPPLSCTETSDLPAQEISPIDLKTLDNIKALRTNSSQDFFLTVINLYLKNSGKLFQRLHAGLDLRDAPALGEVAHNLKSSSDTLGAHKLAALCGQLEAACRNKSLSNAKPMLSGIEAEYRRVRDFFRELSESLIPARVMKDTAKIGPKPGSSSLSGKRPTVLIVDDDPIIRLLARQALEPEGFEVAEAEDGDAAIALLESNLPDLVLLDVVMPRMDGFSLCETIRTFPSGSHLPVLMITGQDDIASINRSYEVGATDFISKPINWLVLQQRIQYMLRANEVLDTLQQSQSSLSISLKEKEALLKEVHHRVKNNIQIISSLLNLQANYISDTIALEIINDSRNRVQSMALIHDKLYRSKDLTNIDFAPYVGDLVSYLLHSYVLPESLIDITINIDEIFLGVDTAIPLGLIINELLTNAFRHAFPEGRKGEIMISSRKTGEHTLSLTIIDNGVGFPTNVKFSDPQSLGLQLVDTLIEQLKGGVKVKSNSHGTIFEIVLPGIN